MRLRCTLLVALAVPLSGAAGCGGGSQEQAAGSDVAAADFRFQPRRVEVRAGETVKWTNIGRTPHTVKGRGFFSTPALDAGQSYSHRFTQAGTYDYLCTLHPVQMKGVIVVG